ncbi:MAG: DUF4905 domain-containing protein [Melioribacteraceae bacterium]|nr:DUF4905 domain-containing protein [Melioribacteraceae bacterium]MCO6474516.1 DUF4905 domain-containing protein [Melioribacteraceae bacterium]MDD3557232.1 DUF4905 domain-containing protein [Melioribacteraceae bacterium]
MKIKKAYSFSSTKQIWRLLISETGKLVIESRDTDKKEVYFSCLNIETGEIIFNDHQIREKFWIGIDEIYGDIMFLHKFAKPDMPGHREIIAFDLNTQKVLWENDQFTYHFTFEGNSFVSISTMTGDKYFLLDPKTGEFSDQNEKGREYFEIKRSEYDYTKDYSDYVFPERYSAESNNELSSLIEKTIEGREIIGNIEFGKYGNLFLMNYHFRNKNNLIENRFAAIEIDKQKTIFKETLNRDLNAFVPDSFFVYKDLLILLVDKQKVKVHKMI